MITDYHAKLYATELTQRYPSDCIEKFASALMDSRVDLNPHQIDAAVFAFRSPLSNGAILADEVGLGKTIEAGIVLSQKWAERKRKILIILPSSLRKQWYQELQEKFYLPSQILESKNFNKSIKEGKRNPFDISEIVLCSYYFARNKSEYVKTIDWDLVVIDEAHRLRNVYKKSNKIARELREALLDRPKLLLTATPLQNSLLELYGLVSFIDEYTFGDLKSYRGQFSRLTSEDTFDDLKERLKPVCKRTLRRQVLEYIKYTERKAYTQEFIPSDDEEALYDLVSEYLRRPNLQALPSSQRSLMTLVLRKLLASSTFAIAGALDRLANKLEQRLKDNQKKLEILDELEDDFDGLAELEEEWGIDFEEEPLSQENKASIREEISELQSFYHLAMKITHNAKGKSLLEALNVAFRMTVELGGAEKAIIFTESRRTQNYLLQLLSDNGYADDIVLFNGSNNDVKSREIYSQWKEKHQGTDLVTGSRTADIRAALVDYFKNNAKILIATEAAAEGINLQFCSMVVNYDLPWNPQRIEQRIGRCHRYGQKHDVVVVNFLNRNNAADQRVYELLSEKFKLFNGVFGASDEILGSIESGVDFEKRIVEIYQTCRTHEEIQASFDRLQAEMSPEIDRNLQKTRQNLLETFDAEVSEKLNIYKEKSMHTLNKHEAILWDITRHYLDSRAEFDDRQMAFKLTEPPSGIASGHYTLKRNEEFGYHYRTQHPLAQKIISHYQEHDTPSLELVFDYSGHNRKISVIESLVGQSGLLSVHLLTIEAFETEDHIICAAMTDTGTVLGQVQARRLFDLKASVSNNGDVDGNILKDIYKRQKNSTINDLSQRNAVFFEDEMDKLEKWAQDRRKSHKFTLKDFDDKVAELKKQARLAPNLPEKIALQKKVRDLNKKRDDAWKEYDVLSKEVEQQKDGLIDKVEARLNQKLTEEKLFTIRWRLV